MGHILTPNMKPLPLTPRTLVCYRYHAWAHDYDVELVWELVQRHQGHLSIRQDCVDFFIAPQWATMLIMAYPDLVYMPDLDYV